MTAPVLIAVGFALGAPSASAETPPVDDRVAIRIELVAPTGCPGADEFAGEVRARTEKARNAVGDEPARVFRVEITSEGNAAIGRMVVESDGERSGARVLRGRSCGEVSSALALTAALSIDPAARLVLEPAPVATPPPVTPPAREAPPRPVPPPAPTHAPSPMGLRLGAAAGVAQIVAPGLMPVVGIFNELAWPGRGALAPAVRISVDLGSNVLAGEREATFTWLAGGLELCPLIADLGGSVAIRPCGAAHLGSLHGRGRDVALPNGATRAWGSAGASLHVAWLSRSRVGVELFGNALLPFRGREFVFENPPRDVARTPTVSIGVGLGIFVAL